MNMRSHTILIAALGGEGGGVMADWIITAATIAGFPIQSTSVPGVAQRTGATTYYLEVFPRTHAELGGAQPILALTPTAGDVDVVVASELVEAGRAMQNGFVTPGRTTLIASTSRVYAIGERMAMADGRFDSDRILETAKALAKRAVLFDGEYLVRASGSPINAIMFGALIAARTLPFDRITAEQAIRQTGKAADSNLRGFALGYERAGGQPETTPTAAPAAARADLKPADFPAPAQEVIAHGVERLLDYQGGWYARSYLERLHPVARIERQAGSSDFILTQEVARYLALWMSYEDVIRVADLKTRAERGDRIRQEVRAKDSDIVRVADFLKPGLEELCSVLPPALGQAAHRFASKRGWQNRLNVGMHIRSTNVGGFIMLRGLAGLRWWRPYSWRYRTEHDRIEKWLSDIARAAQRDLAVATEIASCGQIMKGYGDTHARAVHNFELIARTYFDNAAIAPGRLVPAIEAARKAALADPEGESLAKEVANALRIEAGPFSAAAE